MNATWNSCEPHMLLLIHPPVSKPCEPPAGISRLAGALKHRNMPFQVWDANIESFAWLFQRPQTRFDTFTHRAFLHKSTHLAELKSASAYSAIETYHQAVKSLDRLLYTAGADQGTRITFSNYTDTGLSPLKSKDLLQAASFPEKNFFYPFFKNRLEVLFETLPIKTIGISLNYLSQALPAFAIMGIIKRLKKNLRVVLGGGLATSWLSRPDWKNPFSEIVDEWVSGPGEAQLIKLLGGLTSDGDIPPDYTELPLDDYFSPCRILPYSAAAGCYYRKCDFCPEKAEKNRYHPLSVEKVLTDLSALRESVNPGLIHFLDNAISPKLMKALAETPPEIPWYGFARFTHHLSDPEFCERLKRSGCVMLQLGLESGDQKVLDNLHKGVNLELASRSLQVLHKSGIATYVYLLFGTPGETLIEASHTLDFVTRHKDHIDFLNLAIFNLPAFSPDQEQLDTMPFYQGDLSLYTDFKHPLGWNRFQVRTFLEKEFKRHPAIHEIVKRDPPWFSSNHAPFFPSKTILSFNKNPRQV